MTITVKKCDFLKIDEAEEKYNAKYVGMFCLKTTNGGWSDEVAVFYQPNPTNPEYDPYFGLYIRGGHIYITSAMSTVDIPIIGVQADNGEIIYSSHRHDYVVSEDKSVFIDGGRGYVKTGIHGRQVVLVIEDGELRVCDNPDALFLKMELRSDRKG